MRRRRRRSTQCCCESDTSPIMTRPSLTVTHPSLTVTDPLPAMAAPSLTVRFAAQAHLNMRERRLCL